MTFDACFLKTGTISDCLSKNGRNGEDITCDHKDVDFVLNSAARTSLHNWLTKTPPTPEYISGPATMTKHTYTDKDNITSYVYIIGELHGEKNDCSMLPSEGKNPDKTMEIQDFLSALIETSPVFLDLFVELPHDTSAFTHDDNDFSYITKIYNKLKDHIPPIKGTQRPYRRIDNARIHAIDVRPNSDDFLDKFIDYLVEVSKREITGKDEEHISETVGKILADTNMKIGEYIQKYLITKRVRKDLDKLTERQREWLLDAIEIFGPKIHEKRVELYMLMRQGVPVDEIVRTLLVILIPISAYKVDIYLMSRMFKTFRTENEPNSPFNSVIYVGNKHANVYRVLFSEMGYEVQSMRKADLDRHIIRCLHVDTEKAYPFFDVSPCAFA